MRRQGGRKAPDAAGRTPGAGWAGRRKQKRRPIPIAAIPTYAISTHAISTYATPPHGTHLPTPQTPQIHEAGLPTSLAQRAGANAPPRRAQSARRGREDSGCGVGGPERTKPRASEKTKPRGPQTTKSGAVAAAWPTSVLSLRIARLIPCPFRKTSCSRSIDVCCGGRTPRAKTISDARSSSSNGPKGLG